MVCFNNLTDYRANFDFVSHVLTMDDTFPDNQRSWRSLSSPTVHHLAYLGIILTEGLIAFFCLAGSRSMWKTRKALAEDFAQAKRKGILGLTLGVLLWWVGFMIVGGEWFLMWQSSTWNGLDPAFRNACIFVLILIYLHLPDPDE